MGEIRRALAAIIQDRKELGHINQKKLARRMGCSESQVSSLLSGERRLNEDWIFKFCHALEIGVAELLETSTDSYAGRCSSNPSHRTLHRRLQNLLDFGLEDLVQVQLSLLEAYLQNRNARH